MSDKQFALTKNRIEEILAGLNLVRAIFSNIKEEELNKLVDAYNNEGCDPQTMSDLRIFADIKKNLGSDGGKGSGFR